MEWILIALARLLLPLVQALPLPWVARLGRLGGTLAWHLDRRHRRVALANLERCFATAFPAADRKKIARENFRRIGENYASGVRTAIMTWDQLRHYLDLGNFSNLRAIRQRHPGRSIIVAIGHFGNFEP